MRVQQLERKLPTLLDGFLRFAVVALSLRQWFGHTEEGCHV